MIRRIRVDAPFWAFLLLGLIGLGSLGCLGIAVAQTSRPPQAEILTTDNCPPPLDL